MGKGIMVVVYNISTELKESYIHTYATLCFLIGYFTPHGPHPPSLPAR